MKQRDGDEQIIAILHEAEVAPTKTEIFRQYGISEQTYYRWWQFYGSLDVPHLRRLKPLEAENARLKRLVGSRCWRTRPSKRCSNNWAWRERRAADEGLYGIAGQGVTGRGLALS